MCARWLSTFHFFLKVIDHSIVSDILLLLDEPKWNNSIWFYLLLAVELICDNSTCIPMKVNLCSGLLAPTFGSVFLRSLAVRLLQRLNINEENIFDLVSVELLLLWNFHFMCVQKTITKWTKVPLTRRTEFLIKTRGILRDGIRDDKHISPQTLDSPGLHNLQHTHEYSWCGLGCRRNASQSQPSSTWTQTWFPRLSPPIGARNSPPKMHSHIEKRIWKGFYTLIPGQDSTVQPLFDASKFVLHTHRSARPLIFPKRQPFRSRL